MAEIKVRLTGDNADFKKKLEESSAESRKAAAEMKEQFGELSARAGDIAGEQGLGKIGGILKDLAGGAVLAFGTALVGAIAEGVKKYNEFGDSVARLGIVMGNMQLGKEMGEYIEKIALVGAGPNKDQLMAAAFTMGSTGTMKDEEIRAWLPRIQRLSAADPTMSAQQWGEMIAGGSVGITRGLEHSPLVRGAMATSGIKDPLEALARVSDTTFLNSLDVMANRPSGKVELAKRQGGNLLEQTGGGLQEQVVSDIGSMWEGIKWTLGLSGPPGAETNGIHYGNPSILNKMYPNLGSTGETYGASSGIKDLSDAAKNLNDSTKDQRAVTELLKGILNATQ